MGVVAIVMVAVLRHVAGGVLTIVMEDAATRVEQLVRSIAQIHADIRRVKNSEEDVPWPIVRWSIETIWPTHTSSGSLRPGEWRVLACRRIV